MAEMFIMAIDQGTTSSRAIIFNHAGQIVSSGQLEHEQIFPRAGWVEHNPDEIRNSVNEVMGQAFARARINRHQIAAVGITNQRETTLVWDRETGEPVDAATLADLAFAWRACRAVKSNAILLAHGGASVGVGMGQVNRVDSCKLAVDRAGDRAVGSVAASDAFFPFNDGPQILLDAGVKAIVQPGGSVRDEQTIEACKKAGVTMYFTGTRHFFH